MAPKPTINGGHPLLVGDSIAYGGQLYSTIYFVVRLEETTFLLYNQVTNRIFQVANSDSELFIRLGRMPARRDREILLTIAGLRPPD